MSTSLARPIRYNHHAALRSKIRLCDRFLGEIVERLQIIDPTNFEAQELRHAATTFRSAKISALTRLEHLPAESLTIDEEVRRRQNEILEEHQVALKLAFVNKLRGMGDFRQAQVHLLAILQIRSTIERESTL